MKSENKRLTLVEAAVYLGRSQKTIRNWLSSGTHPKYEKEGGRLYFWTHDLDAYRKAITEVHQVNIREWNRKAG